jgi:hypothetical protein
LKINSGKLLGNVYRKRNKVLKEAYKTRRLVIGHIKIPKLKLKRLSE